MKYTSYFDISDIEKIKPLFKDAKVDVIRMRDYDIQLNNYKNNIYLKKMVDSNTWILSKENALGDYRSEDNKWIYEKKMFLSNINEIINWLNTKYFGLNWVNHAPPQIEDGLCPVTFDDILSGPIKDEDDLINRKDDFSTLAYYVYRRKICLNDCILQLDMFLNGTAPILTVFHDELEIPEFSEYVKRKRDDHMEQHYKSYFTNSQTRSYIEEINNNGILNCLLRDVPQSNWHLALAENKDMHVCFNYVDKEKSRYEREKRVEYLISKTDLLSPWLSKFSVSSILVFNTFLKNVSESEWDTILHAIFENIFW